MGCSVFVDLDLVNIFNGVVYCCLFSIVNKLTLLPSLLTKEVVDHLC